MRCIQCLLWHYNTYYVFIFLLPISHVAQRLVQRLPNFPASLCCPINNTSFFLPALRAANHLPGGCPPESFLQCAGRQRLLGLPESGGHSDGAHLDQLHSKLKEQSVVATVD